MKNILIFSSGFVAGILATIFFGILINTSNQPNDGLPGLTIFPEKGECITTEYEETDYDIRRGLVTTVINQIEIFQVLAPNMALARTGNIVDGIVVLLINYDGKTYYDAQKIEIPANKCARQIGTYQYNTQDQIVKTVPAVVIE